MPQVVKDITIGWGWIGDKAALKGFNIALCRATDTPLVATVAFATVKDAQAVSHIFKAVILDTAINYVGWVQALYEGGDSDWISSTGGQIADDGTSSIVTRGGSFTGTLTATVSVNGVTAATVATAATNFNGRNDRIATAIVAPTVAADGTCIDHTVNNDGSANISFEWIWSGTEAEIDGFRIYVRASTNAAAYTFGTSPIEETIYLVPAAKRAFILSGVAADHYYTFGVQAYRVVDADIDATGLKVTSIVKSTYAGENPYRPSASVAFAGDVTGTIDGTSAAGIANQVSYAIPVGMHTGGFGDLRFAINKTVGGGTDDGEVQILGTTFYHPDGTKRSFTNDTSVTTPYEGAVYADPFYLVWTDTAPNTRFSSAEFTGTCTKIFPAIYDAANNQWKAVGNAGTLYNFTPVATDCILARAFRATPSTGITGLMSLLGTNVVLPADGATVGAPSGTNVGSTTADNVATVITNSDGRGVNICHPQYSNWEENGLPAFSTTDITLTKMTDGTQAIGTACLKIQNTSVSENVVALAPSSSHLNIKIAPNKKWILSFYGRAITSDCYIKSSVYVTGGFETSKKQHAAVVGSNTRFVHLIDLSANSYTTCQIRIYIEGSKTAQIDAVMLEEYISGTAEANIIPSTYNDPAGIRQITSSNISDYLASGVITDAYIDNLSASKITAGTITSKIITLDVSDGAGDSAIKCGKTDFGDTTSGFIIGIDDSDSNKAKFEIGDSSNWLKWTGAGIELQGSIKTASSGKRVTIDSGTANISLYSESGNGKIELDGNIISGGSFVNTLVSLVSPTDRTGSTVGLAISMLQVPTTDTSGPVYEGLDINVKSLSTTEAYNKPARGIWVYAETKTSNFEAYGIYATGTNNNAAGYAYGGIFALGAASRGAPLRIYPSGSVSAPTHIADIGSLWVTSAGVLYINTSGSTTWAKVGAQ